MRKAKNKSEQMNSFVCGFIRFYNHGQTS